MIMEIEKEHEFILQQISCLYRHSGVEAVARFFYEHAKDEEWLMYTSKYSELAVHRQAHRDVLGVIRSIPSSVEIETVKGVLVDVLTDHVNNYDKKLLEHLQRMP